MFEIVRKAIVAALGGSMTKLGLGIMTSAAASYALNQLVSLAISRVSALPPDALRFLGASGVLEAMSIIASAKLTKVAFSSIKVVKK